jgi:hypothetical protein
MMAGFAALALAADYSVTKKAKVGGEGGFDYVYADSTGRKLYVPRSGNPGRVMIYNLDTLAAAGEIPEAKGVHGAAVSAKTHHGFASSNPVLMWDTNTLKTSRPSTCRARRTVSCTIRSTTASTSGATARRTPR